MTGKIIIPSQVVDQPNPRQGAEGTPNASAVEHRRFTISREQLEEVARLKEIAKQGRAKTENLSPAHAKDDETNTGEATSDQLEHVYPHSQRTGGGGGSMNMAKKALELLKQKAQATTSP